MPPATSPALLHRFLGIGQAILAGGALAGSSAGIVPLLRGDRMAAQAIGYVFAGICGVLLAIAWLVLRPRVPVRPDDRTWAEYWADLSVVQKALPVWFLGEGAGVFAVVGFALTGVPILLFVMLIALLMFWLTGPNPLRAD